MGLPTTPTQASPGFLSAFQNAVQAINTLGLTAGFLSGNTTSPAYSTSIVLSTQAGWVANAQVIVAGSAPGYIYNGQNLSAISDPNTLMTIQNTLGIQKAHVNFNNGLVLVPGPGQLVNVTYSLNTRQAQTP